MIVQWHALFSTDTLMVEDSSGARRTGRTTKDTTLRSCRKGGKSERQGLH